MCAWKACPSSSLVSEPSAFMLQPPAYSSVSPDKPPPLHCHWGWLQVAPHSSQDTCQTPQALQSSLFPLTLTLHIKGALSFLRSDNSPLLLGGSIRLKMQQWEQSKMGSSPPCLCGRLEHTVCVQVMGSKHINQTQVTKLVMWIIPSFPELLFDAFLELNFWASLKKGHGEMAGEKMTPWCCHGQLCWLYGMLPICSKRSWCLYWGLTTNWCQSSAETWNCLVISGCTRLFLSLQVYLHFFYSQKCEEVHCGRQQEQLSICCYQMKCLDSKISSLFFL